jgi:hypothetical protein
MIHSIPVIFPDKINDRRKIRISPLDVRRCAAYYSWVCLFWEVSEGRDDASSVFSRVCRVIIVGL